MKKLKEIKKTIKKGKHRNGYPLKLHFGKKKYIIEVTFDNSWVYCIGQPQDQINKLFGFGALPFHHFFSRRYGAYYDDIVERVRVYKYNYVMGKRIEEFVCFLSIGIPGRFEIESYYISVELGPYFGGNVPAPHDINFDIKVYEK